MKEQRGAKAHKLQSWWFGNTPVHHTSKLSFEKQTHIFCTQILKIWVGFIYIHEIKSAICAFRLQKREVFLHSPGQMISEILKDWPSMHGKSLLCKLASKQLVVSGDKMLASGQDSWNHSFLHRSLAIPMERKLFSWAFLAKLFCALIICNFPFLSPLT